MKVDYYSSNNIENIKSQWEQLENGVDMTIFQSYRWNQLLIEEYNSGLYNRMFSQLGFIVVSEGDDIIMIAPIIIQTRTIKLSWIGRKKGIYILGYNSYSDYLNFIYSDFNERAFLLIIGELKSHFPGLPIYIYNIREKTDLSVYLTENNYRIDHISTAAYVRILENIDEYNKTLSKSVRQNLRTAQNRMVKAGLTYELVIRERLSENEEDESLANRLQELHQKRVTIKNGKKDITGIRRFSRILMYANNNRKEKKYSIIKNCMQRIDDSVIIMSILDNKIVGYLFGLRDKESVRILQNCFDEEYKFYSPMFRGSYDYICSLYNSTGIKEVDFTRGDEEYKYKLGGEEITLKYYVL